jgi:tetratricopeptide (TPR) repeat protein
MKRTVRLFAFFAAFVLAGSVVYSKEASGHPDAGTKPRTPPDKVIYLPDSSDMKVLAQQAARLDTHPNDEKIFYMTTQYLRKQRKFVECQKISEKYAKDHPSWAAPYVALGCLAKDQGDDDAELAFYKRALAVNPNCLTAIYKYADLLRAEARYKESIEYVDRGLRLLQGHPDDLKLEEKFLRAVFLGCKGRDLLDLKDFKGVLLGN